MAPTAQQTGVDAPIVTPHSGQHFLESTNFQISQDPSVTSANIKSIFKKDYPPYVHYGRSEGAKPPPLSEVMHRDPQFFNEKASETTHSFEYRFLEKPEIVGTNNKLSATNFKMDRDLNKFHSFETVHNSYFTPKMGDDFKRLEGKTIYESHIPQGDKEKENLPFSDYREKFKGHDTRIHKLEKAPRMHEAGPETIRGDARQTNFNTTHNNTFQGRWQSPVQTLPALTGSSIPGGDPDKVVMRETTMNASFPAYGSAYTPYSMGEVSRALNHTNFKHQDGHNKWNDYKSTATVSFQPSQVPVERYRPGKHRNHSDVPEGDMEPARVGDRINLTTNRFYHGNPPRGSHNVIVSGSGMRTRSNVWFGEPTLSGDFYNTTHNDTFDPKDAPYTYKRGKFYKSSDIPLSYYSRDEIDHTTQCTDYKNPRQGKTEPNPLTLENLKKSHLFPPISDNQLFSTTHNDTFTPKRGDRLTYDAGRLQKSSVPLGTLAASATF